MVKSILKKLELKCLVLNSEKNKILYPEGFGQHNPEGAGRSSVQIKVFDTETGIKTINPSMSEVARALGVPSGSLIMYISRNTQMLYKGKYLLQKRNF